MSGKRSASSATASLTWIGRDGASRSRFTFGRYVRAWFADGPRKRGWKPRTVLQYVSPERRLVGAFGHMRLAEIRPRHVAAYIAEHKLAPATVGMDVSLLHAIFTSAMREELIEANPAASAERPKVPRRKWRILDRAEVARIAKAFTDEQARTVFLALVLTGLRRHELQALRWGDVDLLEGVLRVRDSKSEDGIRSIALTPRLIAALEAQYRRTTFRGEDELVFCHPERGSKYDADKFKEALEAAQEAAGVEGKLRPFHDLRHTAITHDAAAGASAIAVMTKAGHSDMRTTKTYLHLAGAVFREEAEQLERRLLGEPSTQLSTDLSAHERT
jgi:integrase